MTIEKVFAIEAEPAAIWDALWADLSQGDEAAYVLEGSSWPSRLQLRVALGGVRCSLTYKIEQKDGFCEVAANIVPLSKRYGLYQLITFGHLKRNYEMLLVTGLANLKEAVEGSELPGEWQEVSDLPEET